MATYEFYGRNLADHLLACTVQGLGELEGDRIRIQLAENFTEDIPHLAEVIESNSFQFPVGLHIRVTRRMRTVTVEDDF